MWTALAALVSALIAVFFTRKRKSPLTKAAEGFEKKAQSYRYQLVKVEDDLRRRKITDSQQDLETLVDGDNHRRAGVDRGSKG